MVEPRQGGESECWLTLILVVVAIDTVVPPHPILVATGDGRLVVVAIDTVVLPHPILVATGDVLLVAVVALAAAVEAVAAAGAVAQVGDVRREYCTGPRG